MDERNKDILLGIAIGAILVYILVRPKQQTMVQPQYYQSLYNDSHEEIYNNLYQISNQISNGLSNISNRLKMVETRIQTTPIAQINPLTSPTSPTSTSPSPIPSSYKNNEKWIITRDKTGHIDSLEIVRDAKINK
jgi:gas vesicle protein